MVDNLAVAHLASEGTQRPFDEVGLRLMRRTTVVGTTIPSKRPNLLLLPHMCVKEDSAIVFDETETKWCSQGSCSGAQAKNCCRNKDVGKRVVKGYYCIFSLSQQTGYPQGEFDTRDSARSLCRALSPKADLALPMTPQRNKAAQAVASATGVPHWIGGDNTDNHTVRWLNGIDAQEVWGQAPLPWHHESGQPNDCDGPGSETCMFMGPHGKWFDFACGPKGPITKDGIVSTPTPGPEVTWENGERQMFNLQPLCGMFVPSKEAIHLGFRLEY